MPFLTKGKTNWKFIGIFLILVILVGGVLGCLNYFKREMISLSKFSEIKKPEKVVKDETANWKTYRIEDFLCGYIGYEIKYPPDILAIGWEEELQEAELRGEPWRCPAATLHVVSFIKIKDTKRVEVLTIETKADPDQLMYKAYEKEGAVSIKINEIEGLKIKEDLYVFSKSEKLYLISTENYSEVKELFNQMLSTFRFLE